MEKRSAEAAAKLEELQAQLAEHKRHRFGRKSEKITPVSTEVRRAQPPSLAETAAERRHRAEQRNEKMETVTERSVVPESERCCPKCTGTEFRTIGEGKPSALIEYVQGYFRKRVTLRESLECSCGHIINAPVPDKSTDRTRYAPSFVAHLMVSKCAHHLPLYRLEKHYRSLGVPIARSTMTDLLHRNAELLQPLVCRLLARIAASEVVHADETPMRQLGSKKRSYIWTFHSGKLTAYVFSQSRSGETPKKILGDTQGTLVVDAYSGYNIVSQPGGRTRAGCLGGHARRKVFAAHDTVDATDALDIIRELYLIEAEVESAGIKGTAEHLALRQTKSAPLMAKLFDWAERIAADYGPKSTLGSAARYILNSRDALSVFLDDPKVPLDNNPAEQQLRRVALGRKNYLFVGDKDCGTNIANVYSLVATCELNGVNPQAYLEDVLLRVQTHPASRIDELLPDQWRPPDSGPPSIPPDLTPQA